MIITKRLLSDYKMELEDEIEQLSKKIKDEYWEEARRVWLSFSSDLEVSELDEHVESIKLDYITELELNEEKLLQVNKELNIINNIN